MEVLQCRGMFAATDRPSSSTARFAKALLELLLLISLVATPAGAAFPGTQAASHDCRQGQMHMDGVHLAQVMSGELVDGGGQACQGCEHCCAGDNSCRGACDIYHSPTIGMVSFSPLVHPEPAGSSFLSLQLPQGLSLTPPARPPRPAA